MTICITGWRSKIAEEFRVLLSDGERPIWGKPCEPDFPVADRYLFCHGLIRPKRMEDQTQDERDEGWLVNYISTATQCDWIIDTNPTARICIIGSESGYRDSFDGTYAVAKRAIHLYVEGEKLGPCQQLVAISPGIISDCGMTLARTDTANLKRRRNQHPMRRFLMSREVAELPIICFTAAIYQRGSAADARWPEMKERVVTLMWGTAWERYGRTFTETFECHWPDDVELFIVTDRLLPTRRATQILLADVLGYSDFMTRWGHKRKDSHLWRHDAVEWAAQGMAPRAALDGLNDGDILAWFDADVETLKDIPHGWLDSLVNKYDMACLQRSDLPTELGFWGVRVNPDTRRLVRSFAALYSSGVVFEFPDRHSGCVFDIALAACPLLVRNLNPSDERLQPWGKSPLAEFTVHHKGGKVDDPNCMLEMESARAEMEPG